MFKRFEEFVNENNNIVYRENDERELIQAALYQIAKSSGFHIRYLNTDRNYVKVIVPTGMNNDYQVSEKLAKILDSKDIKYSLPKTGRVRGDDQFLKINYQDLVNFGYKIHPKTDGK